jgi:hypothetical protein
VAKLGDRLQLLPGWKFRAHTPDKNLTLPLDDTVKVVPDDLRNVNHLVPTT